MDAAPNNKPKYEKPSISNTEILERAKKMKTKQDFKDDLKDNYNSTRNPPGGASTRYHELDSTGAATSMWFMIVTLRFSQNAEDALRNDQGNPQLKQARENAIEDYNKACAADQKFIGAARKYDAHLREEKKRKREESAALLMDVLFGLGQRRPLRCPLFDHASRCAGPSFGTHCVVFEVHERLRVCSCSAPKIWQLWVGFPQFTPDLAPLGWE